MNIFGRPYSSIVWWLLRGLLPLALTLAARSTVVAQSPGDGPVASRPPLPIAVHPILVAVEFEGNDKLTDEQLLTVMETHPTKIPLIKRFFSLIGSVITEFASTADSAEVQRTIDSLGGEVRYLNLTTAAADTARMLGLYNDFGYHDAHIRFRLLLDTARNTSIIRYIIQENPRYAINGVHYFGLEDVPEEITSDLIHPQILDLGRGFSKDDLLAESDRIVGSLKNSGYAFAAWTTPTLLTARKPFVAEPFDSALVFIYPGTRYRVGQTIYTPDTVSKEQQVDSALVLDQREYNEGEWYNKELIDQTVANLYELGTFDIVSIDTVRALTTDSILGLNINTRLRALHDFRTSPEFSLEKRFSEYVPNLGITSEYILYNLFGKAQRASVSGRFLTPLRSLATQYPLTESQGGVAASYYFPSAPWVPFIGGKRLSLLASGSGDFNVVDRLRDNISGKNDVTLRSLHAAGVFELAYRLPRYTLFNLLSLRITLPSFTKYYTIGPYIRQLARLRVQDSAASLPAGCDTTQLQNAIERTLIDNVYRLQVLQGDDPSLLAPGDAKAREQFNKLKWTYILDLSAIGDHRDDYFSPTSGNLIDGRAEFGVTGGLSGGFLKGEIHYRKFIPMNDRLVFAYRGHIGMVWEVGALPLTPISSRFSAGGASSLRGWAAGDMLATRSPEVADSATASCADPIIKSIVDENRRLLGGLGLLEISAEFRYHPFDLPNSSSLGHQLNQLVLVGFADAGNAFFRDREDIRRVSLDYIWSNIGLDVGLGLGYDTPIGPIRIGAGIPIYDPVTFGLEGRTRWITNRPFFPSLVVHFGIGHAF
ncbi:MAG: surface antigen [Chlorobi bacterium]|nr:surface antigen [Chlorobiota bacterium]